MHAILCIAIVACSELLSLLTTEGRAVTVADPTEFVVGNMVLRILKLVREEQTRLILGSDDVAPADAADALHVRLL